MNDRGGRSDIASDLYRLADRYVDLAGIPAHPNAGILRAADQLRYIAAGIRSGVLDAEIGISWRLAASAQLDDLLLAAAPR